MKETKEGRDSMVYDLADIQRMLKIGRTASYDFIAKAYKEGSPFPVLRVGSMYRIPRKNSICGSPANRRIRRRLASWVSTNSHSVV